MNKRITDGDGITNAIGGGGNAKLDDPTQP